MAAQQVAARIALATLLLVTGGESAMGQRASRDALARLHAGTAVRITTRPWNEIEGTLGALAESSFVVNTASPRSIAYVRVEMISVRARNFATGATVVGSFAGLIGGLYMAGWSQAYCEPSTCESVGKAFATGFLLGAASGAAVGLVIGSFSSHWRIYWTRSTGFR